MSSPAAAPPPLDNHRARDLGYRDAAHLQREFEKAARIVRDDQDEMVREATSADKLRLYGYYKQVPIRGRGRGRGQGRGCGVREEGGCRGKGRK